MRAQTTEGGEAVSLEMERHYTPQEIAETWQVSVNTIRRMFRGEPGVLEFGSDETRWSRKRKTLRIPASVLMRVHQQFHRGKHGRQQ